MESRGDGIDGIEIGEGERADVSTEGGRDQDQNREKNVLRGLRRVVLPSLSRSSLSLLIRLRSGGGEIEWPESFELKVGEGFKVG